LPLNYKFKETWGRFMANSFLSFSATNEFEIYHSGSTQSRVAFIAINAYIAIVGFKHFTG